MSKKRSYDEVSVVRILSRNRGIQISGSTIKVLNNSGTIGNGTWGKIDYLVNHKGYHVEKTDDRFEHNNRKDYAPRIMNVNNINKKTSYATPITNGINIASMTKMAMKNLN